MGKIRRYFTITAGDKHRTTILKCHIRHRTLVSSLLRYIYFLKLSSQLSIRTL